jgi:hypothetical protein
MPPPNEGFNGVDCTTGQLNDRLVVHVNLASSSFGGGDGSVGACGVHRARLAGATPDLDCGA